MVGAEMPKDCRDRFLLAQRDACVFARRQAESPLLSHTATAGNSIARDFAMRGMAITHQDESKIRISEGLLEMKNKNVSVHFRIRLRNDSRADAPSC
jgi:hypothetical protein